MIEKIDLAVITFTNKHHNRFLDELMGLATRLGNVALIWLFFALLLITNRSFYFFGVELLETIFISGVICNIILKPIFERNRPYKKYPHLEMVGPELRDYSFPSGHTVASFSSMTILAQINPVVGIGALLLAILIAFSRIYLNVHYFTDVICGVILGTLVSICIILF